MVKNGKGVFNSVCRILAAGSLLPAMAFADGQPEPQSPQEYFYDGADILLEEKSYRIRSNPSELVNWSDGNILVLVRADVNNCCPLEMIGYMGNKGTFKGGTTLHGTMKLYGMKFNCGESSFDGSGRVELGAGGYDQSWNSWDDHMMKIRGGLHLADSQTWKLRSGAEIREVCPLTAKEGITWTLSTHGSSIAVGPRLNDAKTDFASRGPGLVILGAYCLTDVTVVMEQYARLHMPKAGSALNAKELVLDGNCAVLCRDYNSTLSPEINGMYATNLVLRNGAVPALQTFNLGASIPVAVDGLIYDLESVTIESGTSIFGKGVYSGANTGLYSYSVKNGGTLPVIVNSGATVKFESGPTAGQIEITGSGTVDGASLALEGVGLAEDFTGTVLYSGANLTFGKLTNSFPGAASFVFDSCVVSIADLEGFTGKIAISNGTRLALPSTGTWGDDVAVTVADTSIVYLPEGGDVDTAKLLGTGRYDAVAKGLEKVEADEITVGAGEVLVACGEGFTPSTKIILNGGLLKVPVDAHIASPVEVLSKSYLITDLGAESVFSGPWTVTVNGSLEISNTTTTVKAKAGRSIFTGPGTVKAGGIYVKEGDVEFRGPQSRWTFENRCELWHDYHALNMKICEGAYVNFADAEQGQQPSRQGLVIGTAANYPAVLEITTNSTLRIGPWRQFRMGRTYYACDVTVDINGGTLLVEGDTGEFNVDSFTAKDLKNTSADRCSSAKLFVRNGGVLETDRLCTSPIITHKLDTATRMEGLSIFLDGGTWRLGDKFGTYAGDSRPWQHPNMLFGGVYKVNDNDQLGLTNTCEVFVSVEPGGGVFDLSRAREGNVTFTNTVMNAFIPVMFDDQKDIFPSGYYPNLGPRWNIKGRLTVKGNGNQEFVLNGLDAAQLGLIGADGATVKVVSDSPAAVPDLTLGAGAGGWSVETEEGEPRKLTVGCISVEPGGRLDASCFDAANLEVTNVVFGAGAVLCAPENGSPLSVLGTLTLSPLMWYYSGGAYSGTVISAADGIAADGGGEVVWAQADGSRKRIVRMGENCISFEPMPFKLIFR